MSGPALPAALGGEPVHPMTAMAYEMLGSAMTNGDREGGWLMLKFMDSLLHELKPVWDLVLDNMNRPGGWDLFNPNALQGQTLPWLPWLMQFTGDYYDTSVIGIDPSAPSPDQILRNKVTNLRHWRRGTTPVIKETVLERLPSGAKVTVHEWSNDQKSSLSISILVGGEIPTPLLAAIYQAIYASIPAGDHFDLTINIGPSFDAIEASLIPDTFASLQQKYPTFDSWPTIVQAPYTGPLPPAAVGQQQTTTWYEIETFTPTWQQVESFGSWQDLEQAGV